MWLHSYRSCKCRLDAIEYNIQHNYIYYSIVLIIIIYNENMQATLQKYYERLATIQNEQKQTMEKLKQQYKQIFAKQLEESAEQHWKKYRINKKPLQQQLKTISYYIKVNENAKLAQQQQQSAKWAQTLKNVNLYSLMKSIDDKIIFNRAMLTSFKFACSFPVQSNNLCEELSFKSTVLESQCKEYENFITSLITKLSKSIKQQYNQLKRIQQKYTKLLRVQNIQQNHSLKTKDTQNYTISALVSHKYLRHADLWIVTQSGILDTTVYQRLGEALLGHRFYLQTLHIKLMDMQFCQQKCDILIRYLKKLRVMSKLTIHNYYGECKLGEFTDFNWHPYRKAVNIKSGVWK